MEPQFIFNRISEFDQKVLSTIESSLVAANASTQDEVRSRVRRLERRPVRRWWVLGKILEDAEADGIKRPGAGATEADWEAFFKALAEFIKAIAPIIFELIGAF